MKALKPGSVEELADLAAGHRIGRFGQDTGITVSDASGLIVSANSAAERILCLSLAQLQGRDNRDPRWACVDQHGTPLAADDFPANLALDTRETQRDVVLGVHRPSQDKSGEHVWLSVCSKPVYRPGDRDPRGVLTTFTVIGGRKAAALQAAHADRLYRTLTENSGDVIVLASLKGLAVWISPAARWVLGYDPQDLVGVSYTAMVHPEDLERMEAALGAAVSGAPVHELLCRVRHAAGRYVVVEATTRLVNGAEGRPTHLVATLRDVEARIEAERARDTAVRRFEAAMRHAPIGMLLAALDGSVLEVNEAMAAFLGYQPEELVGRDFHDLTSPEDHENSADTLARLLSGEIGPLTSERRYLTSDGRSVWGRRTVVLVRDDEREPAYFLTQVQDITDRKQVQTQLAELAMTDPLTGMPNRLVLLDRLTHALAIARREGSRVAVMFLDLDLFKEVNDTHGHMAGDAVLRQVGGRLTDAVRDEDTALRLGGDEFVLLCENITDTAVVQQLAERVSAAIAEPYEWEDQEITLSVSIGVAIGDGPSAEALLSQADSSMYRAKRSGRSLVNVYEEAAQADAMDRLALETELRTAIGAGQLELHYQPVVNLVDKTRWGAEALLRWRHPTQGLLLPDRFLPAAEHTRLIVEIGNWVLERACADASTWVEPLTVAVNVSARQLAGAEFSTIVRDVLTRTGLDPRRLCLEITESSTLHASAATVRSTASLLELGVRLALDDFGTGQSSISILHQLRIHSIKIDRSFVAEVPLSQTAANLVDGLIHLGRGMGLDVIAEGVETAEQAAWLIEHGCPRGQGFLFGHPEPIPAAVAQAIELPG